MLAMSNGVVMNQTVGVSCCGFDVSVVSTENEDQFQLDIESK